MKTNGHRDPAEIQADIARTRSDLDHTLSAIEQRLTPSQLIDQGVDYLRHSGAREYFSNLGTSAKQEPIPLALVGIGLAWLMMSNGRSHTSDTSASHLSSDEIAARARSSADAVAEGVRGTMSSVRDTAARTSHRISEATHRLGETAHAARERASHMSAAARERAVQVRDGYDRLVHEHPLALGAIGLAVGAVLAAAAPRTRQEDRLMGDASHRMKESAKETGQQQLDRASEAMHRSRAVPSDDDGFDDTQPLDPGAAEIHSPNDSPRAPLTH